MTEAEYRDLYTRWLIVRRDTPGLEGEPPRLPLAEFKCDGLKWVRVHTHHFSREAVLRAECESDLFRPVEQPLPLTEGERLAVAA